MPLLANLKTTRRAFLGAAALGGCAALMGGCSINGILPGSLALDVSDAGTSALAGAAAQASASRVLEGGTLVCQTAGVSTLHPHGAWGYWERLACRCVFDCLTEYDFAQKTLVGKAATSWESDAGSTRFTFHLREGATFHNGETVTAGNFADAWNALCASREAPALRLSSCLSMVGGYDEVAAGQERAELYLECPDDYTLVVNLGRPFADFAYIASLPQLAPLPFMAFDDQEGFRQRPSGNGAFCLAGRLSGDSGVLLSANSSYWGAKPHVASLRLAMGDDFSAACDGLAVGDDDVVYVPLGRADDLAGSWGQASQGVLNPGSQVLSSGINVVSMLVFNCVGQTFSSVEARHAVAWALDAAKLARKVGVDASLAADSPLTATNLAYEKGAWSGGLDGQACAQTVVDLWQQDSSSASVEVLCDPCLLQSLGEAVVAQLRGVGIPATLSVPSWSEYAAKLRGSDFDLALVAHRPRSDAAAMELFGLFYTDGDQNLSNYSSQTVDAAFVKALDIEDEAQRLEALREASRLVAQDRPVVPLLYAAGGLAVSGRVNDLSVGADLMPSFAGCWLSA